MDKFCLSNQRDYVLCKQSTQSTINAYFDEKRSLRFPNVIPRVNPFRIPLCYFDKDLFNIDEYISFDTREEPLPQKIEKKNIQVKKENVIQNDQKEDIKNEKKVQKKVQRKEMKKSNSTKDLKQDQKKISKEKQSIEEKKKKSSDREKKNIETKITMKSETKIEKSKSFTYTPSQIQQFIHKYNLNDSPESFSNRNQDTYSYQFIKGFLNENEELNDEYICNQMTKYYEYKNTHKRIQSKSENSDTFESNGIIRDKYTAMSEFELIDTNLFTHRRRNHETASTAFRCSCIPKSDSIPCGKDCINRQMFYECNPKVCLNRSKCTNCQFRKKQYQPVYFKLFPHKGWGLLAANDIKQNTFIGEYVGEVIYASDLEERIQRRTNKHVYLMTLGKGEIIDATYKGGLFRYINHSCDPNCETQKWTVDGESCIGIFARRDIKRGEELTFDYRFERYTDEDNTCYCGSANCRGTIGEKRNPLIDINPDKAFDVGLMDTTYKYMDKRICNRVSSQVIEHLDDVSAIVQYRYLNKKNRQFRLKHPRYQFLHRNNLFLNRNIHCRYRFYSYIEKNEKYRRNLDIFGILDKDFKQNYKDNIYKFV